ncbi:MAG: hypothetical protein RI915_967 [Pseudomonadota bacterium]|jgi:uncharacterized protein with von Willebrand factor type A (vWA) domain
MLLGDARSGKLSENITGFARALRRAGLPVDAHRIGLAIEATTHVGLANKDDLSATLRACLVNRQEDLLVFDQMFSVFFKDPELTRQLLSQLLPQAPKAPTGIHRKPRVLEALAAKNKLNDPVKPSTTELEFDAAMSASERSRLKQADFQQLNASEFNLVEHLARQVKLPLPKIIGRRTHSGGRGERIHWSKLMQMAARQNGEVLSLPRMQRKRQPLPLLILVDISGSMERYARLLLAFLHQATRDSPRQIYAFGTELTDLSQAFKLRDTDDMLMMASEKIRDFAGGTQLGKSLTCLRTASSKKPTGRRTVVLLISDGLDTGSAETLDLELAWLKRHSRSLLWLNPLLRYADYAPIASGARVLNRHADGLLAIHNLARLEELAQALTKLLKNH